MTIPDMQQAILDAGWQFEEHIFNDGGPDCYVNFSNSKSPHVFGVYPIDEASRKERDGVIGWGRFWRQDAWERAYAVIITSGRYDNKTAEVATGVDR